MEEGSWNPDNLNLKKHTKTVKKQECVTEANPINTRDSSFHTGLPIWDGALDNDAARAQGLAGSLSISDHQSLHLNEFGERSFLKEVDNTPRT